MDFFHYKAGALFAEDVAVAEIAAAEGTPLYIYSRKTINLHLDRLKEAFAPLDPLICYSVKANSNLSVLKACADRGTGFDIVSGGELHRVASAGADMSKVVFAGVGKTAPEIKAALSSGILMFNVESESELAAIDSVAAGMKVRASVALRVNPDVDSHAHEYTTTGRKENKFGIVMDSAEALVARWSDFPNSDLVGLDMHIGSQVTETEPYALAIDRVLELRQRLQARGHEITWFDLGGGFGIFYRGDEAVAASDFAAVIIPRLKGAGLKVILEPGRFVIGNAGILVTRVTYVKRHGGKRFLICDAGMNDLVRPTLYGSFHRIWPVETHLPFTTDESVETPPADVVGPICESGDFLAKDRPLPDVDEGGLLAVFGAGAYGMVMASNYNSRPRAAEVMVDAAAWKVVRRRETFDDLLLDEKESL